MSRTHAVRGLAMACHPGPAAAVTALAGLLTLAAGGGPPRAAQVALVVLVGQLSIGWSNDWVDAGRDAAARRADKPVALGLVPRRSVGAAALGALALTVPLSFGLGLPAGAAHLLAVGSAWAYNVRLKSTLWSWVPFALSFGLLPAVATLALPGQPRPPGWVAGSGALLGVGAHLANVLPDLEDDALTGVRGLPHRLGRRRSSMLATLVLTGASVLVALGPPGAPGGLAWAGVGVALVVASAGSVIALRLPRSRLPLLAAVVVAGIDVALLLAAGPWLTG